jgi:hypothetical protein
MQVGGRNKLGVSTYLTAGTIEYRVGVVLHMSMSLKHIGWAMQALSHQH